MEGGLSKLGSKKSYININFDRINYNCSPVTANECNKMANGALCEAIHGIHHLALIFEVSCAVTVLT
jgi:hypothetical protein